MAISPAIFFFEMEAHTQTQQRQPSKAAILKSSPHPPESPPYESPENSLERPVENSKAIVAVR
jgi:hypothetical protein